MRWLNAIAMLICLIASAALAQQREPAQEQAPEDGPPPVVRTYNVADLMRVSADYPLDSEIEPPTGYGRGAAGPEGMFVDPGTGGSPAGPAAPAKALAPLEELLMQTIDPDSWQENGGADGRIKPFGSLLVVTQTPQNHEAIQQLLDEIRKQAGPSQIVSVRATWVLTGGEEVPAPASVVNDEWLAAQTTYCEGRTVCFSGQTVHITSGRGRRIIQDLTPIVSESAVAFDPQPATVQSGVSLQVAPQLVPGSEAAILDVHSYASEWHEPGPGAAVTGAVATQPSGTATTSSTIDRIHMTAQEMKTTLRVPLGKRVLIGGMTLDPTGAGQQQQNPGRQLCLIVEVNAVR